MGESSNWNLRAQFRFALTVPIAILVFCLVLSASKVSAAVPAAFEPPLLRPTESWAPNSGNFSTDFAFDVASKARHDILPRLSYNSSTGSAGIGLGWSIQLPYLQVNSSDLSVTFFDGGQNSLLAYDLASDSYFSRFGLRFVMVPGGAELLLNDGKRVKFLANSAWGANVFRLYPTKVTDKDGWETNFSYISDNGRKLLGSVSVDAHPASGLVAEYVLNLGYLNGGNSPYTKRLDRVEIVTSSVIRTHKLEYRTSVTGHWLVDRVNVLGANSGVLSSTRFDYYGAGDYLNLLSSLTVPYGGAINVSYGKETVVESSTGKLYSKIVARSITSDDRIAAPLSARLKYLDGKALRGEFLGFKEVSVVRPDLTSQKMRFFLGLGEGLIGGSLDTTELRGLNFQIENRGSSDNLISQSFIQYQAGGPDNKFITPTLEVLKRYAPSGASRLFARGVQFNFGQYRPTQITNYGQITSFDQNNFSISDNSPQDNVVAQIAYEADIPLFGIVNPVDKIERRTPSGTRISEMQFDYLNGNTSAVRVWDNVSNSYVEVSYEYDQLGRIERLRDGGGRVTGFNYSGHFLDQLSSDPDGLNLSLDYDFNATTLRLDSVAQPSGIHVEFSYDGLDNLRYTGLSYGPDSRPSLSRTIVINGINSGSSNNYIQIVKRGTVERTYLDGFGRPIQHRQLSDPATQQYQISDRFYGVGGLERISLGYPSLNAAYTTPASIPGINYSFNSEGKLAAIDPDTSGHGVGAFSLDYEEAGNPRAISITDPLANWEKLSREVNATTARIGSVSKEIATTLTRNLDDLTKSVMDLGGNIFEQQFSSLGLLVNRTHPIDQPLTYEYDGSGLKTKERNALGYEFSFEQDSIGRVTQSTTTGPGAQIVTYHYDFSEEGFLVRTGELASLKQSGVEEVHFGYNNLGDLTHVRQKLLSSGKQYDFQFNYNAQGLISKVTYPNGVALDYQYVAGYEKKISSSALDSLFPGGLVREILSRNSDHLIQTLGWGNDVDETLTYFADSHALENYSIANQSGPIFSASFQYDDLNLISETRSVPGESHLIGYQYNSQGQVRNVAQDGVNSIITWDNLGRLVSDPRRNTWQYRYLDSAHPYKPSGARIAGVEQSFNYDAANLLRDAVGNQYSYDARGRLISASEPDGDSVTIHYGVLGSPLYFDKSEGGQDTLITSLFGDLYRVSSSGTDVTSTLYIFGELTEPKKLGQKGIIAELSWLGDQSSFVAVSDDSSGGQSYDFGQDGGGTGPGPRKTTAPKDPPITLTPHPSPTPSPSPSPSPPPYGTYFKHGRYTRTGTDGQAVDSPRTVAKAATDCEEQTGNGTTTSLPAGVTYSDPCDDPCIEGQTTLTIVVDIFPLYESPFGTVYADSLGGTYHPKVMSTAPMSTMACHSSSSGQYNSFGGGGGSGYTYSPPGGGANNSRSDSFTIDDFQTLIDEAGIVDPSPICDGINCTIYLVRFKFLDAGISALGMLSYIGDTAKGGRLCKRTMGQFTQSLGATSHFVPENSRLVYRVWGGKSGPFGGSWTPVDPRLVDDFRYKAGLPNVNDGTKLTIGRLKDGVDPLCKAADPLDGNRGGLREFLLGNAKEEVEVLEVIDFGNSPF